MAITVENLKKQMEESLSTRFGGSLLMEKTKLDQSCVTVFIGLGGLGGRAVNAIKSATREKLNNEDRRFFLVVDTCRKDMNKISVATAQDIKEDDEEEVGERVHGCIEAEEKMTLYSDSFLIGTLGTDVNSWLNRAAFDQRTVNDLGAQGVRQIGRVMLMGHPHRYEERFQTLRNILVKAKNKAQADNLPMKVYIVSGIGGGTGSGTTVDFAYMVRKAMADFDLRHQWVEGILFTPDVQQHDAGMKPDYYKSLCVNFYAAIKEIDYFFNNKARGKAYVCPVGDQVDAYKSDIFDQCTLVSSHASGIGMVRNSDELVLKFANAIAFELSGIEGVSPDGTTQSYEAFYSNINTQYRYWYTDNSEGQGLDVPDFFPHRYSALGYTSFYVPRDEITAYCANMLIERMVKDWTEKDIKDEEIKKELRKYGLISNKAFAAKLFALANSEEKFGVEKKELPKDGLGILPVQNCENYLVTMREIADGEARPQNIQKLLAIADSKIDATIIKPILSAIDTAFTSTTGRGPVYAINLLSAHQPNRKGFLYQLVELLSSLDADARTWELELDQLYTSLLELAQKYDGQVSIDSQTLDVFTANCRKYGEERLAVAMLKQAGDILRNIYTKLNDENNRLFAIYTTTFDFLKDMLKKDGEYVLNTNRRRDGHTTVFTFDIANFQDNDVKSQRFKKFFAQFVDNEDIAKHANTFINDIFGRMKKELSPVDGTPVEFTEKDVIGILRSYFRNTFSLWAREVVEKFCVLAYSAVEVSPSTLTEVWENIPLRDVALQAAADAIESKLKDQSGVLLTSADPRRNIEKFASYTARYGLVETGNINTMFDNDVSTMPGSNWSEFINYKRIFSFPLPLLADLKRYRELYHGQSTASGMHLDEVGDDWRYSLPEPFDYNVAKLLEMYERGGKDVTEPDHQRMVKILELAKQAKELGILTLCAEGDGVVEQTPAELLYYRLVSDLLRPLDIEQNRDAIYANLKAQLLAANGTKLSLVELLTNAGYEPGKATDISWHFDYSEYNVMKNRTDFGDDVIFGNFITLIRSNYEWEQKLANGVALYSKLNAIYEEVVSELEQANVYKERLVSFMKAIRVGYVVPFYNGSQFMGIKIKKDPSRPENDITFSINGLEVLDLKFLLYLAYTEAYLPMDAASYNAMCTLVNRQLEEGADRNADPIKNVKWFFEQVQTTLTDGEYLAHYDPTFKARNFAEKLNFSKYEYALPTPSNGKANVGAVIDNLQAFYEELRKYLKDYYNTAPAPVPTPVPVPTPTPVPTGSWTCNVCSTGNNTGNFCMQCGAPKPAPVPMPTGSWTCTNCGTGNNTGNFCMQCGSPKPAANWICTGCGTTNTGNFCGGCGRPKG